jgi:uncharacterized membrane protein
MNYIIKDYGIFVLVYILFIAIITLKFGYYKQAIMITLLLTGYLYYKSYYSSLYELFDNSKNVLEHIAKGDIKTINKTDLSSYNHDINNHDINNSFINDNVVNTNNINHVNNINDITEIKTTRNLKIESTVIEKIPSISKLNTIKVDIYNFIDEYIPEESRKALQVKQQNNKVIIKNEINNLINKYFEVMSILISTGSEELNYFQQLKTIEKEILTLIHNSVFLNHQADNAAGKLISDITHIFTNIQTEITRIVNGGTGENNNGQVIHKKYQSEYIPTINEFKEANSYEDNILF